MTHDPNAPSAASSPAAPPAKPKRRLLRLAALFLPAAALAAAGVYVFLERGPLLETAQRIASGFTASSGPAGGAEEDAGPAPGALEERLTLLEQRVAALAAAAPPDSGRLSALREGLDLLDQETALLRTDAGDLRRETGEIRDLAGQALREARAAGRRFETASGDSGLRADMVEADVKALVSSLSSLRDRHAGLSARLEALAGDLHLMARFGYGRAEQPAGRSALTRSAPLSGMIAGGGSHGAPPEPPELIQGRYRVGDWVGGWGVVTSIRRTPEGDHLTTPSGVAFAPAARPAETSGEQ